MDFPGSPRLLNGIGNEGGGIEEIRAQDRHVAGVHLSTSNCSTQNQGLLNSCFGEVVQRHQLQGQGPCLGGIVADDAQNAFKSPDHLRSAKRAMSFWLRIEVPIQGS